MARRDNNPVFNGQTTHTQKSILSQAFKWKKIMFFVIPEMPSETFVMLYKKLPDHFKRTVHRFLTAKYIKGFSGLEYFELTANLAFHVYLMRCRAFSFISPGFKGTAHF